MTAAASLQLTITMVRVDSLQPSPTNPRKTFTDVDELAASIKAHGLQVPLIVRPHPLDKGDHEIVAGERRWRAAKKAGLEEVPTLVRDLTDLEVLEVQLIENAQRADVHPVEEAEAFKTLHLHHKLSVDEIAAKLGKSKSYVYGRMKLAELAEPVRKAALAGELPATHALLLARVPPALQVEALKGVSNDAFAGGGMMSFRKAHEFITKNYTLRLADVPWELKDEQLVPAAGSCTKCPKRTGNQPELFADLKVAKDTCTDQLCFRGKKEAFVALQLKKAHDDGKPVLSTTEAKKLFTPSGTVKSAEFVDLDHEEWIDGKYQSLRQKLGKKSPEVTLAPTADGLKELARKEDVDKLLGRDKEIQERLEENQKYKKEDERRRAADQKRAQAQDAVRAEIVRRAEKSEFSKGIWFEIATSMLVRLLDYGDQLPDDLMQRRLGRKNHEDSEAEKDEKELRAAMSKMSTEELRGFVVELHLEDDRSQHRDGDGLFAELKRMYGVDEKKLLAGETPKPSKPKKKPATKAASKKKPKAKKK